MKRLAGFIFGLALLLLPLTARADEGWKVNAFQSQIVINADGTVSVSEDLAVDFGSLEKHGIYRDIPEKYVDASGNNTFVNLDVRIVTSQSQNVPYTLIHQNGYLRVKIGDPNKTIHGHVDYHIEYRATGALLPYDTYDELYWNVTGNLWSVPIEKASATITLPSDSLVQQSCYVGDFGSKETCQSTATKSSATFLSRSLNAGEGLTVAVGYTKDLVPILKGTEPPTFQYDYVNTYSVGGFFLGLIGFGLFFLRRYWKNGRDEYYVRRNLNDPNQTVSTMPLGAHETITPEYEAPKALRPAEIGTLIDERADTVDISATIVDLAVRGFLTITEEPKQGVFGKPDYILSKLPKEEIGLLSYESLLLTSLFDEKETVRLSELKDKFYTKLSFIKDEVYREVTAKKYFPNNPQTVRNQALWLPIGLLVLGMLTIFNFPSLSGAFSPDAVVGVVGFALGMVLGSVVGLVTAVKMPRRTAEGREVLRQIKGYQLFLSQTEKYRQPFFEDKNLFMTVLPYAMVFGVTKKLARAMEEMGLQPNQPTWYYSSTPWNAVLFANSFTDMSQAFASTLASSPSSSGSGGGGFSGGGFGGGGGGSW